MMNQRTLALLTLILFGVLSAHAQVADSIRFYKHALQVRRVEADKALRTSMPYVADSQRLVHFADLSKGYMAFTLYFQVDGANFNAFNQGLEKDGFPPFKGAVYRPGVGFSYKANGGVIIDFDLFTIGFNKTSKSNGDKVRASYTDYFQLNLGYAVVNKRAINIYPYAGISLRGSDLSYNTTGTANPNFNSIASLIQNNRSGAWSTYNLAYQAGLEAEFLIGSSKDKLRGTMLFCKFGTDGMFGTETYKIDGVHYSPNITYGQWSGGVGFKFFGKL